jgi:hypothetical protein
VNGQTLTFGADGAVEELDAFLYVAGAPSAVSLSAGVPAALPDLALEFEASLSADASDLQLTWAFRNDGTAALPDVTFLGFLDAEIAEATTTFFDELGGVAGSPAPGQGFEIDEPGYVFGDIAHNVLAGSLDGTNALAGRPEDVAMALSFDLGPLAPGTVTRVVLQLSEDGDFLGPLALEQSDPRAPGTRLAFSGVARAEDTSPPVPEPGAALLYFLGASLVAAFSRRREEV